MNRNRGIANKMEAVVPEWNPERQILTVSEDNPTGFKSGGSIELRIDGFSEFVRDEQEKWSEPIYIRGLHWQILANSIEPGNLCNYNGQSSFNDLEVYLCCDRWRTSKAWECKAKITLRIVAQKQGVSDINRQKEEASFGAEFLRTNYPVFWQFATCDMLDPEKGYNKDDTIILQADVQLLSVKMYGLYATNNASLFSSSTKYRWDFVLVIQNKEVHVYKRFLARHSEYFKDKFAKHERAKRAVLQDVDYDDFIELLSVIYPLSLCHIKDENVEVITDLAFKFYMTDLLKRCEVFLVKNFRRFCDTLLMAERYGLTDLQEAILEEIKSVADIKEIKSEYDALSDRSKRMLFDKICSPGPVANLVSELERLDITDDREKEILQELVSSTHCEPSGVLVVENNRIPIHKEYLAIYSKVFKEIFQGEFAEGNIDEVVLKQVDYHEILELLVVIYPTKQQLLVTEKNVGIILKMADRFIMPSILERCKKLLQDSTQISAARKLWLAQRYNLPDLQVENAKKCKTMSDVEELKAEPEFGLLDDKTRVLILDSITS